MSKAQTIKNLTFNERGHIMLWAVWRYTPRLEPTAQVLEGLYTTDKEAKLWEAVLKRQAQEWGWKDDSFQILPEETDHGCAQSMFATKELIAVLEAKKRLRQKEREGD